MALNAATKIESLQQQMSQMSLPQTRPVPSPVTPQLAPSGTKRLGTPLRAQVNYFSINLDKMSDIYVYTFELRNVDQQDTTITGRKRHRIISLLLQNPRFKAVASDYVSKLFSLKPLIPSQDKRVQYIITYYEEGQSQPRVGEAVTTFGVLIGPPKRLAITDFEHYVSKATREPPNVEEYMTAFNMFLSRKPSQDDNTVMSARQSKFFDVSPQNRGTALGRGLHGFRGFFRAAIATQNGLMLNLNMAATAMVETGTLIDVMHRMEPALNLRMNAGDVPKLNILSTELHSVRVRHNYTGKPVCRSINRFPVIKNDGRQVLPTVSTVSFRQENRNVTVRQHFASTYNLYLDSNEVVIDLGSPSKPCFVPISLLSIIPGNLYRDLLPHAQQTAAMIKFACKIPRENSQLIHQEGLRKLGIGHIDGPEALFSMAINTKMETVSARKLPPPKLALLSGIDKQAESGSWNLLGKKFKQGPSRSDIKFSYLEILAPRGPSCRNLEAFLNAFSRDVSIYTGCSIERLTLPGFSHSYRMPVTPPERDQLRSFYETLKKRGADLVIVVLPERSQGLYAMSKYAADIEAGVHTIHTVRQHDFIKSSPSEIANLALKLNMKFAGVNWVLQNDGLGVLDKIMARRIMFVGADVTHPGPSAMAGAPSVAAVVGTTSRDLCRYVGRFRLQTHDKASKKSMEIIRQFSDMLYDLVQVYAQNNRTLLPEAIFIYRDGVADSMYGSCLNEELKPAMKKLESLYLETPLPKLIYIVVQKRHHTRFYSPTEAGSHLGFDAKGNPLPGFVVDDQITHPRQKDWFAVSHKCIQGTSRPAHYTVLYDNGKLSMDELQYLTHCSCWLMGRATKSISIHPAARYADMLCNRARYYLRDVYNVPPGTFPRPQYVPQNHWLGDVHENMLNTMFWV